ncbi:MAG: hypothetical protein ABJA67_18245 [Chthonomonadales bacterium]
MSIFKPREWEDPKVYSKKLQNYSVDELEDVYNHIHILKQPFYYSLLVREMEARGIVFGREIPKRSSFDVRPWLGTLPILQNSRSMRGFALAVLALLATAAVTFLLFMPIWMFAIPFHFLGIQTALVYLVAAPLPPILGIQFGVKFGGRGWYSLFVIIGAVIAVWMFNATGAPAVIIEAALKPSSGGASPFGGF